MRNLMIWAALLAAMCNPVFAGQPVGGLDGSQPRIEVDGTTDVASSSSSGAAAAATANATANASALPSNIHVDGRVNVQHNLSGNVDIRHYGDVDVRHSGTVKHLWVGNKKSTRTPASSHRPRTARQYSKPAVAATTTIVPAPQVILITPPVQPASLPAQPERRKPMEAWVLPLIVGLVVVGGIAVIAIIMASNQRIALAEQTTAQAEQVTRQTQAGQLGAALANQVALAQQNGRRVTGNVTVGPTGGGTVQVTGDDAGAQANANGGGNANQANAGGQQVADPGVVMTDAAWTAFLAGQQQVTNVNLPAGQA